jgi:hypothetical protein
VDEGGLDLLHHMGEDPDAVIDRHRFPVPELHLFSSSGVWLLQTCLDRPSMTGSTIPEARGND